VNPVLLYPGAAALNQDDQDHNKQNAGDNLDNRGTVHYVSPSFNNALDLLPSLDNSWETPEPKRQVSVSRTAEPASGVRPASRPRQLTRQTRPT